MDSIYRYKIAKAEGLADVINPQTEALRVGITWRTFGGSVWEVEVEALDGRIVDVQEFDTCNYAWTYGYRAPRVGELVDDYLDECEEWLDSNYWERTPYLICKRV